MGRSNRPGALPARASRVQSLLGRVECGRQHARLRTCRPCDPPVGRSRGEGVWPTGRMLAVGSMRGQILLWETATGKLRHVFDGYQGGFGISAFSPDGRLLVAGGTDTTALVWDLRSGVGAPAPLAPALVNSLW